jgi:small GTP-binding protein
LIYNHQKAQKFRMSKVILIGSSGVGKSCLLCAFLKYEFDSGALPTTAPAYAPVPVLLPDGRSIELNVWDTAGQEAYRSLSQMFYRDAQAAVLCFTREEIDSIGEWVSTIRETAANDCSIYLTGTKIDLLSLEGVEKLEEVGNARAAQYKGHYFATSSATGVGVSELLLAIAEDFGGRVGADEPGCAELGVAPEEEANHGCC